MILLFLLMFRLNPFLAGVLPGGGRWQDDPRPDSHHQGVLEVFVVQATNRKPVRGVTILVTDPADRSNPSNRATSDARGQARIEGLPARPHRIDAQTSDGIASAWGEPGRRIVMALSPRPRRRGRVHDGRGAARPATVMLLDADARVLAETRTDADGNYDLPDHANATGVCARPDRGAPGAAAKGDILIEEGDERMVHLDAPSPAEVDVFAVVPDTTEDRLVPLRTKWQVDANGSHRGRLPAEARAWIVYEGEPMAIDGHHSATSLGRLYGIVEDAAGHAIANARAEARPLREGLPVIPFPRLWRAATDAHGRFITPPVPEGHYALTVSAAGFARVVIANVRTQMLDLRVMLPAGYRIGGRVLDEAGDPVAGAQVTAFGTPDPQAIFPAAKARTTDDGRFFLDRLGGEFARVQIKKRGYRPTTMMRVARNGNATIILRPR